MATYTFIQADSIRNEPSPEDYIQWNVLPYHGESNTPLNRWSFNLTRAHDFPGAQVC